MSTAAIPAAIAATARPGRSLWQDAWARLRKNHVAVGSLLVLIFIGFLQVLVMFVLDFL